MKKEIYLLVVLSAMLLVFGCVKQTPQQIQTMPEPNLSTSGFIIDSHIHYEPTDEWEQLFVKQFEKWNAIGCILVDWTDLERGIAFAKAHSDNVVYYK